MSLFGKGGAPDDAPSQERQQAWSDAIQHERLPDFVSSRLEAAANRKAPWLSTMSPAELLLGKSHGIRPVATVSGTCWARYGTGSPTGYLTDEWGGFGAGWDKAVARMKREAVAAGAHAVVDVHMRSSPSPETSSADFTVLGTAIRFDRLAPSRDPVIATVSALDFVRLLELGIVVCGMGIGSAFDFIFTPGCYTNTRPGGQMRARTIAQQMKQFGGNQPVMELSDFWLDIRRRAHQQLRETARNTGRGVLAHTHLSQLCRVEDGNYFGRHIVIGTVVDRGRAGRGAQDVRAVVDMRDERSPLHVAASHDGEAMLAKQLLRPRKA
jgi:hypothetical protein